VSDIVRRDELQAAIDAHQKEMVLGAMGISIPLFVIAAIFTGLAGILVVAGVLAVIAVVSSR
jgi:hypothetical protein